MYPHSLFTPCSSVQKILYLLIRLRNFPKGRKEVGRKIEEKHATEEQILKLFFKKCVCNK